MRAPTQSPAENPQAAELDPRDDIRDRIAQGVPVNEPVYQADATWVVGITTVCGGETLYLDEAEVAQYNADPDLFAAKHFGFKTADEYREWIATDGGARCSERTKSGELCRVFISRIQLDPSEWKKRHRSAPCTIHGGSRS